MLPWICVFNEMYAWHHREYPTYSHYWTKLYPIKTIPVAIPVIPGVGSRSINSTLIDLLIFRSDVDRVVATRWRQKTSNVQNSRQKMRLEDVVSIKCLTILKSHGKDYQLIWESFLFIQGVTSSSKSRKTSWHHFVTTLNDRDIQGDTLVQK